MDCTECFRLISQFEKLELVYAKSVDALSMNAEPTYGGGRSQLRVTADEARIDYVFGSLKLRQHQRKLHNVY